MDKNHKKLVRRRQTLERKATFIGQVMHGRLDSREISDIGDTALSFSEVKALATGNPLLMDKAEADANLTRLQRAERAWFRNQDTLQHAITDNEHRIKALTLRAADIDLAISRRRDTRGDAFVMTVADTEHRKRAEAGQHLKELLAREVAELAGLRTRAAHPGSLGGFGLIAMTEQSLGSTRVTISLDGVPGGTLQLSPADLRAADPAGLISRLENRLHRLETSKQEALDGIERARSEITHARASLGQIFPQVAQLTEARDRSRHIDEQLDQIVHRHDDAAPDQRPVPYVAVDLPATTVRPDWRDQVIRSGMDGWMPKAVCSFDAGMQRSAEHDSPEIGQ